MGFCVCPQPVHFFHKKWQADCKNMEEDAKAESKRSLLHLRDGVVIHYFMQNDHNNYQLLQRFSYKKWLSTKLSPDQLSDKDFMDPLLHGFRRFVEIRLHTSLVDSKPRKVKLASK